jgi:protein-S-isoprenylcysteine O-methyltransferase Ste14
MSMRHGRVDIDGDRVMLASALPLLAVIVSIVALGATGNLFSPSPFIIAVQAGAVALSVWARRSFQEGAFRVTATPGSGSIIRDGPYRFVRHPMHGAALLFIWTAVVSHLSVLTLAIGLAVSVVVVARTVVEERLLRARHPEYDDYARLTKALVPYLF